MRFLTSILLVALATGCATDVPLPQTTPFDSNPEARAAYFSSYRRFYRASLAGEHDVGCSFGVTNLVDIAAVRGAWDGHLAAARVVIERERLRSEK